MTSVVSYPSEREMRYTRVVAAPRALVWQVWTEVEKLAQWWGPEGFSITTLERELAVGGIWRFTMHGPDGTDYPNRIAYLEVSQGQRLVYQHGSDADPAMFHVVTEFTELGKQTQIVTTITFRSLKERDDIAQFAIDGHNSSMKRLDALLVAAQ
ncbi:MAG: SRPBCC domain-containing protein [Pseudomonadota bacterium]